MNEYARSFWYGFRRGFTMPWTIVTDYFQFVWWWRAWRLPGYRKFDGSLSAIYIWSIWIGPIEVRKWTKRLQDQPTGDLK